MSNITKIVFFKLVIIGLVSGLISCFVGGGAEIVIVPMLIYMGVLNNYKEAVGTSLASLLLPIGLFAVLAYSKAKCHNKSCVNWVYAIIISIFFTISTLFSYLTVKINNKHFKIIFAIFTILLGFTMLSV